MAVDHGVALGQNAAARLTHADAHIHTPRIGAQLHHLDERPDPSPVSLRDGLAHAREQLRERDALLDNGDFRACHWWDCQTGLRLQHSLPGASSRKP